MRRFARHALAAAPAAAIVLLLGCLPRPAPIGVDDRDVRADLRAGRIVFARRDGLVLARGDGSGARVLIGTERIGPGSAVFLPALSPGGDRLLFLSLVDLNPADSTGRELSLNLARIDGAGRIANWSRIRLDRLAPPGPDGRQEVFTVAAAAWSPDGSRLALGLRRPAGSGGHAIALFDRDGIPQALRPLGERRLARVSSIGWEGGTSLVLGLDLGEGESDGMVARLPVDAGSVSVLGTGLYPAVSPDGGRIAVVDAADGARDLRLLDNRGNELERIERPGGRALSRPFWSRDGRFLYYHSLASTGPLGLLEVGMLRCVDLRSGRVFDLVRLG